VPRVPHKKRKFLSPQLQAQLPGPPGNVNTRSSISTTTVHARVLARRSTLHRPPHPLWLINAHLGPTRRGLYFCPFHPLVSVSLLSTTSSVVQDRAFPVTSIPPQSPIHLTGWCSSNKQPHTPTYLILEIIFFGGSPLPYSSLLPSSSSTHPLRSALILWAFFNLPYLGLSLLALDAPSSSKCPGFQVSDTRALTSSKYLAKPPATRRTSYLVASLVLTCYIHSVRLRH